MITYETAAIIVFIILTVLFTIHMYSDTLSLKLFGSTCFYSDNIINGTKCFDERVIIFIIYMVGIFFCTLLAAVFPITFIVIIGRIFKKV